MEAGTMDGSNGNLDDNVIEGLIEQRAQYRRTREFEKADEIKQKLENSGIMLSDIPYKLGGGSTWCRNIPPPNKVGLYELSKEAYLINNHTLDRVTKIVEISKKYLSDLSLWRQKAETFNHDHEMTGRKYADIAFNFAMAGVDDGDLFRLLVEGHTSEISRFGHRKSCGVMDLVQMTEKLACAGVLDQSMYKLVATLVRGKDDFSMCGSLAALESGRYSLLSDHPLRILWRFAAKQSKYGRQRAIPSSDKPQSSSAVDPGSDDDVDDLEDDEGGAESGGGGAAEASPDAGGDFLSLSLADMFHDPSLPLVLDLGCGYGVAQLGLCVGSLIPDGSEFPGQFFSYIARDYVDEAAAKRQRVGFDAARRGLNFLGCDMSTRAVAYASGVSRRWGLGGRCVFLRGDVVEFMKWLHCELNKGAYSGAIGWISVNFPTPYSQQLMPDVIETYLRRVCGGCGGEDKHGSAGTRQGGAVQGNSQLPVQLSHFMTTPSLISLCGQLFDIYGVPGVEVLRCGGVGLTVRGGLYLQSNAEDVAVISQHIVKAAEGIEEESAGRFVAAGDAPGDSLAVGDMCEFWCALQQDNSSHRHSRSGDAVSSNTAMSEIEESKSAAPSEPSKRQLVWKQALIAAGLLSEDVGGVGVSMDVSLGYHRAGLGWDDRRPFDTALGLTETEAIYNHNQKPVYRQVYARVGKCGL
jgi:SAM-dependent methyltransferase